MHKTALFVLMAAVYAGAACGEPPPPLVLVKTISMAGLDGRIDHMCVDAQNGLLYIAALSSNALEVVDLKTDKWIRALSGPKGPQGVMLLPETNEIAVTSGQDGALRLYDDKLNLLRFLSELKNADNVRYDNASKRVYLGYGKALAAIDPRGPTKVAEIALAGHPESFQVEREGGNIYVNVPESREVIVIDKVTFQITAHWDLLEATDNYPMALDETEHRLFIGCRNPAKVLIYDTRYGSYVGKVDCAGDADDIHYDSERRRIYVTGGKGFITVITEIDPYLYKVMADIHTAVDARTSCFEPASGTLYVAVPHYRKQQAEIRVYKAQP